MNRKASELRIGDVFRLLVCGEVVAAEKVGGRVKVTLQVEDQGLRSYADSGLGEPSNAALQFTDAGHVLEFLCRPSRGFQLLGWWRGDGDNGERDDAPTAPIPNEPVSVNS
jgi:hypothetical protein